MLSIVGVKQTLDGYSDVGIDHLLPRLRLIATYSQEDAARHVLDSIGVCNFSAVLAVLTLRFPLTRVWLHEICVNSASFIHLCDEKWSDEDVVVYLKSLRVLLNRGFFSLSTQSGRYLHVDHLLALSSRNNAFIRYQIERLVSYDVLNASLASELITEDNLLEAVMAGADDRINEFDIGTAASSIEMRIMTAVSLIAAFDHRLLASSQVKVMGYPLPVQIKTKAESTIEASSGFVHTATVQQSIAQLAEALHTFQPILLHGVSGSGKSSLIHEFARLLQMEDDLVILHISDQTDCKALIGSYACTNVPGEFIWIPGIITTAATNGQWVVVEDIDQVPLEFISLIAPLLESRRFFIPALGTEIVAHHNFRMFATRNLHAASYQMLSTSLDSASRDRQLMIPQLYHYFNLWHSIVVRPVGLNELRSIIAQLYPSMFGSIIELLLSALYGDSSEATEFVNMREVLKIVERIGTYSKDYHNLSGFITDGAKVMAWKELTEVLVLKSRNSDQLVSMAFHYAFRLGLHQSDVEEQFRISPQLSIHPSMNGKSSVKIGRCTIDTEVDMVLRGASMSSSSYSQTAYARRLLERLSVCVSMNEPVLLVGETGNGKTTNVQELARIVGKKLVVLNLSLSSDISDLLGGYRPMSTKQLFKPVYEQFVALFHDTLSSSKNNEFLQKTNTFFNDQSWNKLLKAIEKACQSALAKLTQASKDSSFTNIEGKLDQWNDYLKTITRYRENLAKIKSGFAFSFVRGLLLEAFEHGYWILLDEINLASAETLQGLSGFLDTKQHSTIVEGNDANGKPRKVFRHASFRIFAAMNPPTDVCKKELPAALKTRFTEFYVPEMLDEDDLFQIVTGFFPGMTDIPASTIVSVYLQCRKAAEERLVDGSGQKPHYSLRTLTRSLKCTLGFFAINLRPMSRCLFEGFYLNFGMMLNEKSQAYMFEYLKDSLWTEDNKKDMSFPPARPRAKNVEWVLVKPFWIPQGTLQPIDWSAKDSGGVSKFVLTPTVSQYIRSIAAAISVALAPILLQGPTSIGKTSMVQFLAAKVGRKCVRINNHEHTDIQEYVGGYVTDTDGRLVFKDGLLVEALRNGYWIILDELNLAPSDILEALNRLLDDNQELLITETGELVKPADGFQLFATQNPPGIYGGRKPLSLAFRNRFIEIHMGDLPNKEIEEIISQSCGIAPKFSMMMVKTMEELQMHRQQSALLLGKHGMITTRDLIKWGKRQPQSSLEVAYMGFMLLGEKLRTSEEQALVEKVLRDVCKIKESISTSSLVESKIDLPPFIVETSSRLLSAQEKIRGNHLNLDGVKGIAITNPIVRMWTLLCEALKNSEPVLLVGETGCGKTMVCQLYSAFMGLPFRAVNCHQSTETADLIGGLRPVRSRDGIKSDILRLLNELHNEGLFSTIDQASLDQFPLIADIKDAAMMNLCQAAFDIKDQVASATLHQKIDQISALALRFKSLFEWVDGPLIDAMKFGDFFLLDEINLAEDAVIERLNSMLEFSREITLAEKGGHDAEQIVAHPNFRIVATMNPSGDFGKRELSPALRSRFTEVWIPANNSFEDFASIISEVLRKGCLPNTLPVVTAMVEFMKWFNQYIASYIHGFVMTIRELIAWSDFVNVSGPSTEQQVYACMVHGAFLSLLDGIGIGHNISRDKVTSIKLACLEYLLSLCPTAYRSVIQQSAAFLVLPCVGEGAIKPYYEDRWFVIGDYRLAIGPESISRIASYATDAPTTLLNLGRIARAMSIKRPILLEGPPGVGKTSIITNLAALTGHKLVRINLSEHTELSDLLGSDLPCQDGGPDGPLFKWYDGILLKAMKEGSWVLLDELNLAPQTVLEGLNACFDHREQVYLPDIGLTVQCSPSFRVFTAQNPMTEGGGRKGLPASFLSRFTRVFMESLTTSDVTRILITAYSGEFSLLHGSQETTNSLIAKMVEFVDILHHDIVLTGKYGRQGSPWEFNLRDMLRWCDSICYSMRSGSHFIEAICESAYLLFVLRMRSEADRGEVCKVFSSVFSVPLTANTRPQIQLSDKEVRIGRCHLKVNQKSTGRAPGHSFRIDEGNTIQQFLHSKPMELLLHSVSLDLPVLVVGKQGSGRRSSIELLGRHLGIEVRYFTATPSLDTSEMLGAFEQCNKDRSFNRVISSLKAHIFEVVGAVMRHFPHDNELIDRMKLLLATMVRVEATESSNQTAAAINEIISSVSQLQASIDAHEYYINLRPTFSSFVAFLQSEQMSNSIADIEYGFVWLNGVIVDAMERGHWVIFDNVNLCSSSVLDRLNSVLESNGELILNEDGTGRTVKRHKNFRIFLVMDPSLGEVSRAMRNRCVELSYLRPQVVNQSSETLHSLGTLRGDDVLHASSLLAGAPQNDATWANVIRGFSLKSALSSLATSMPLTQKQHFGLVLLQATRRNTIVDYLDQSALASLYQSDLSSCLHVFLAKYIATLKNSHGSFGLQLYEKNRFLIDSFVAEFDGAALSNLISSPSARAFFLAQLSFSQSLALLEKIVSIGDRQLVHILRDVSNRFIRNLGSEQVISDKRIYNFLLLTSSAFVKINEHLQQNSANPLTLYSISFHVHQKNIVPNNRDLILVGYLWPILCLTESATSLTASRYGTTDALSGCSNLSVGYLLMHICQMRNLLVQTLLSYTAESSLQGSLWSTLMIIIKWIEKTLSLLFDFDTQLDRVLNADLKDATKHALKNFHDHYCLFWDSSLVSVKLTLWKQGGHRSVPLRLADWNIQSSLLKLLSSFSLPLPNFLDHGVDGKISTLPVYRSSALGEVIHEWLALLCTFSWQNTNELGIKLKSAMKSSLREESSLVSVFSALIETLAEKLNAGILLIPDLPSMEARPEMQEMLCSDPVLSQIRAELKNRVVLATFFYADLILLDLSEQLVSGLSDFVMSSGHLQDKSKLRQTIFSLKSIIRLGISHSTYHPRIFRPFKAMLWSLEYVLSQEKPHDDVLIDVRKLLRSYLVEISGSIYLMRSGNLVNNSHHVSMSFGSSTLALAIGSHETTTEAVDPVKSEIKGTSVFAHSVSMPFALRHIDMHLLCEKMTSLHSMFPRATHATEVTIAAYFRVKTAVSVAFKCSVTKNMLCHKKPSVSTSRLALMIKDIFCCSQHFFLPECNPSFELIKNSGSFFEVVAIVESYGILEMIADHQFRELFKRCLSPLLNSRLSREATTREDISLWLVHLAVLRLQLLLASLFADPSLRAQQKHSLLSSAMQEVKSVVNLNVAHKVIAEDGVFSEETIGCLKLLDEYNRKDVVYQQKIIERPEGALPYEEMFSFLKNLIAGPLSPQTILEFSSSLHATFIGLQDGTAAMKSLHTATQQENQLQSMMYSCIERLEKEYYHYQDVTSVFVDCFSVISQGVRSLLSSTINVYSSSKLGRKIKLSSAESVHHRAWSMVLSTSTRSMACSVPEYYSDLIQSNGWFNQYWQDALQHLDVSDADSASFIDYFSKLLVFSKTELFLATQQVQPCDIRETISSIFKTLSSDYLNISRDRKAAKQQQSSLYTHRKVISREGSSGEGIDEETRELQENFPTYTEELDRFVTLQDDNDFDAVEVTVESSGSVGQKLKQWSSRILQDDMNLLYIVSFHLTTLAATKFSQSFGSADQHLRAIDKGVENHYQYVYFTMKRFGGLEGNIAAGLTDRLKAEEMYCYRRFYGFLEESAADKISDESRHANYLIDRDLLYLMDPLANNRGDRLSKLFSDSSYNPWNFHFESNVAEALAANPTLNSVLQRAIGLLQVLPNNDVLHRIIKLTHAISQFSVSTPLGKLFQSLQVLLKCIQQYEEFAHSKISFSAELSSIFQLIHRYHALQIKSWQNLLRHQEIKYVKTAAMFWFSLHKVFIQDSLDASKRFRKYRKVFPASPWKTLSAHNPSWLFDFKNIDEEASSLSQQADEYVFSQVKVMETFLMDSNVGEFPTRLHLVRYVAVALEGEMEGSCFLQRLQSLVIGLWYTYSYYLPIVREFQSLLLGPLQQQVKDEVKMSKWDNITIVAMLENTEKAHRKLQKFIKQYKEDVLEYPVRRLIYRENMKDIVSDAGETIDVVQVPQDSVLFPTAHKLIDSSNLSDAITEFCELYKGAKESNSWQADDLSTVLEVIDKDFPNCHRVDKIVIKASRFVSTSICVAAEQIIDDPFELSSICVGINAAVILEDRSDTIFDRISNLRSKTATRPQKQKAFRDLLGILKEEGFSHLRSELPKNIGNIMEMVSLGSHLHNSFNQSLSHSFATSTIANVSTLFQRAETYFVKSISEITQLRVQYGSASHGDVSNLEKIHMMTFSESMLYASVKLRSSIEAGIVNCCESYEALDSLTSLRDFISSYLLMPSFASSYIPYGTLKARCEENVRILRAVVTEMFTAMSVLEFAGKESNLDSVDVDMEAFATCPLSQMQPLAEAVKSMRVEILECIQNSLFSDSGEKLGTIADNVQLLARAKDSVLVSINVLTMQMSVAAKCTKVLTQHREMLSKFIDDNKFSFVIESLHQVVQSEDSKPTSSSASVSAKDICSSTNVIIEKVMLSIQNMNTLHTVLTKNGTYKNDLKGCFNELLLPANQVLPEEKPLTMLLSWTQASLAFTCVEGLPKLANALTSMLSSLTESPSGSLLKALHLLLAKVCDLVSLQAKAYTALIDQNVFAYKSLSKFLYINVRIFRNLLSKGFCSAETKEGDGEGDGQGGGPTDWGDDLDGTGMGEGEGKKDVSDQITNEEQLLDLKKDLEKNEAESSKAEKSSEKLDKEEQDKGVEMDQDFEGDMFDMEDNQENKDDEEDDDEESIDREMEHNGEEINMDNVVSEKQWGDSDDEDEDEKDSGKDKFEKDSTMKGPALPDEMRTKEDEEEEGDGKDESGKDKEKKGAMADDQPAEDNDKEIINEEEVVDKPMGVEVEKGKDKSEEEEGKDDAKDEDKDNASEGDDGDAEGVEEFKEYADDQEVPEGDGKEGPDAERGQDVEGQDMDVQDLPDDMEIPGGEEGGDEEGSQEDHPDPLASEVMDVDEEGENDQQDKDDGSLNGNKDDDNTKESKPLTYGVQDENGEDDILGSNEQQQQRSKKPDSGHHKNEADDAKNSNEGSSDNQDKSNASQKGSRQQQQSASRGDQSKPKDAPDESSPSPKDEVDENNGEAKKSNRREPPNPFLHKGDLRKEWFRRLNIAETQVDQTIREESDAEMDGDDEEDAHGGDKGNGVGEFEYDSSNQKDGEQVLGAVRKDDAVQLPEQNERQSAEPEGDRKEKPERKRDLDSLHDDQLQQKSVAKEEEDEGKVDDVRQKIKRAKLNDQKHANYSADQHKENDDGSDDRAMEEDEIEESEILPKEDDGARISEDMNVNLAQTNRRFVFGSKAETHPNQSKPPSGNAEDFTVDHNSMALVASDAHIEQWQRYLVQTESYAMQLSEQLRLIIEPTLASRLQGDYRTGKRINMRRVISYVASGYRKDKIWLRRTKLAKRAYQVMLLIDDSRSMGLAGDLALQSMALLATALSRLEIGELAVCSFADQLRVLHPFNETFSSQSGGKILSQFKFEANSTRLSESLRAIIPIFNEAKESSHHTQTSNQAVLQLCFVVSDARIDTENRVRLEQIIREMAEQHILVVLVIIDVHANNRDSIFNTRSVSFVDNKVVTSSYLDNFPFPYYVVIQDLQRLPEVLADALKQWFELVKLQLANR